MLICQVPKLGAGVREAETPVAVDGSQDCYNESIGISSEARRRRYANSTKCDARTALAVGPIGLAGDPCAIEKRFGASLTLIERARTDQRQEVRIRREGRHARK